MSISTYSELKTAIANFLNRTDLTSRIPEWIAAAESYIAYGYEEGPFKSDPVRIRGMEIAADLTVNAQSVALPTRYLQSRRIYISGDSGGPVELITPDEFWRKYTVTTSGRPVEFTVEADSLLFGPTPDSSYTGKHLYYQKFAAMSADGDSTALLTNSPFIYVHGAALEGFRYLRNFAAMQNSQAAFCGLVNAVNHADMRDRYSGSPWRGRTDTGNP